LAAWRLATLLAVALWAAPAPGVGLDPPERDGSRAGVGGPSAPVLTVAAASDLRFALEPLRTTFERTAGIGVRAVYGSSGQFAAQIAQGAPFDVFLSADENLMADLVKRGRVAHDSVRVYAIGRLAIWVRSTSRLDISRGAAALADDGAKFIAIANPAHAPYGRAAVDALRRSGLFDRVRRKLVYAESVSHALQLVASGNADVGIVALSLVLVPRPELDGRVSPVPQSLHAPLRQTLGVVLGRPHEAAARRFSEFLIGKEGRAVLRRFGFAMPTGAVD
jgi:molybdate transport system substrate-binding protein